MAASLSASAEALAALGTALRVRATGQRATPEVEAALDGVLDALGLAEEVRAAGTAELEALLSPIRAVLFQAQDLVDDPWRSPGWSYTDRDVLESQGRTSAAFARILESHLVPELDGLGERLARPGATFLDVGVGVGGLAIEMCRVWPELRVVGLDPWDPALALARRNVAAAGLADRVELRHERIEELGDADAFDLVWLAAPFLPRDALEAGVARVAVALRPGAWAIVGLYRGSTELEEALARLRTARSGGSILDVGAVQALLEGAGLTDVRVLPAGPGIPSLLVAARRVP